MAKVKKVQMYNHMGSATIFLMDDGTVNVCGPNINLLGVDGLGYPGQINSPVLNSYLSNVEDVFVFNGSTAACPLAFFMMKDKTVKAAGKNAYGALGFDYPPTEIRTPTLIQENEGIKKVYANQNGTIFILNNGKVKVCGLNQYGYLGVGDKNERHPPVLLPDVNNVVDVAVCMANLVFLLQEDGSVMKLNHTSLAFELHPNISNVQWMYHHNTTNSVGSVVWFVQEDGAVKACGFGAYSGTGNLPGGTPTTVEGVSNVKQIEGTGANAAYFLLDNGTVMCCGGNSNGQLGLGDKSERKIPEKIPNLTGVKKVVSRDSINRNVFFLMEDGTVKACGYNTSGELGLGDKEDKTIPTEIPGLKNVIDIQNESCNATIFIMTDGSAKALGYNYQGCLGLGDDLADKWILTPTTIPAFSPMHYLYLKGDACYAEENKSLLQIATNWSALTATEKKALFDSATSEMPSISSLNDLGAFKVAAFKERTTDMIVPTCRLTAIATDHLVMPKGLIPIQNFEGIDKATLAITTGGQGSCKVLVTTDRTAYQSYDFATQAWKLVDHTDIVAVKANGIDAAQLTNIPRAAWDTLTAGKDGIGFAYLPSIESTSDVCSVDELTLQVDMRGTWERATEADYTYAYPNNTTLRVTLKTDGDYKINYQA